MKHCLFVCSAGVDRSPAAALWALHLAGQAGISLKAHALGLYSAAARATRKAGSLDHYHRIFVMEQRMEADIREWYAYKGDIVCLNIDDRDEWTNRELNDIFQRKFADEELRRKVLYG